MRFKVSNSALASGPPPARPLCNSTTHLLLIFPKIYVRFALNAIY